MADATSTMADAAATAVSTAVPYVTVSCDSGNDYDDADLGVRISAIFVIFVGGLFGSLFPIFSKRAKRTLLPSVVFFIVKYFGSGVIIATAFIHLLAPANDALTSPCLSGPITEYDWAEGIALMTIFVLFFVELLVMRSSMFGSTRDDGISGENGLKGAFSDIDAVTGTSFGEANQSSLATPQRGEDHLSHQHDHSDVNPDVGAAEHISDGKKLAQIEDGHSHDVVHGSYDDYAAQMTAIFILEFGVIFHSIFIGLTLAVTGSDEFNILYVVLVFHQTFEGLGLGTRLAITPWANDARGRLTPYFLGLGYALSTPIAIAIGLGVRTTFAPGSQTALLANGVFDSISAGILLYTGLVELMAHEFMFSKTMQKARASVMIAAFLFMALGAGLMALLGKWA